MVEHGTGTADGRGSTRAQAGTVAVVLIFGMMLVGAVTIVVFGASALSETQEQLSTDRAQKTLSEFDSEATRVALGSGDTQSQVSLPSDGVEQYRVLEETGRFTVTTINRSGDETTLVNTSLGAVTYDLGDENLAYQGGGVWRASGSGGVMVSPPEFHYQEGTLTLPLINITGRASADGRVSISRLGTEQVFPNASAGETGRNPIEDRKINVTVTSDYYRGWGTYFRQRTNSEVSYDDANETVTATLVPPPAPIRVDAGIVAAGNLTLNGAGNVDGPVSLGGTTSDEGAITGTVEENQNENEQLETAGSKIDSADSRLSGEGPPPSFTTVPAGTYYVSNDFIFSTQTTFDTTAGDIELYVDGDLTAQEVPGPPVAPPEVDIVGNGSVEIYADGEFHMNGQPTWGKSSKVDSLVVYSRSVDRITEFYGILYTDAISIQGSGGGGPGSTDLQGALVSTADTVTVGGQVQIEYDSVLEDRVLEEVEVEFATISYLHISEATIEIN